jgi:L-ascorbate metabolism protein UlaG (beta-lactamase superfamily)
VTLIAPASVYASLTAAQKSLTVVLGYGDSTNVMGLNVEAVPAYGPNHPLHEGNGYVLTLADRRIYISGDTGDVPEIRALTDIDVAFVCMNQPYSLTVDQAVSVVRALRPGVVYPYHYRDASGATTNAAAFKNRLGTDPGIEVRLRKWY